MASPALIRRLRIALRALRGAPIPPPPAWAEVCQRAGARLRRQAALPALAGWFGRFGGPAAAVTLGRTIWIHPATRLTDELLAHELVHVLQWRRVPALPLRYLWASLRHGYERNPFEREARHVAASLNPGEFA